MTYVLKNGCGEYLSGYIISNISDGVVWTTERSQALTFDKEEAKAVKTLLDMAGYEVCLFRRKS